jgi:acyl-CoA reductase-like NAD-dependent aldehyde dehydrogenase
MLKLCHLIKEVGFPAGVVNVVPGYGHIAGERLTRHNDITKISFTGSSIVGRKILQASAETNLKKVHLELGGKSPVVIFGDANLEEAVKWVIDAAFRNSSQNCCCGSRLLVQSTIYEDFVKRVIEETQKIVVGSFREDNNFIGPLVNKTQFEKVLNYIKLGREEEKLALSHGGNRMFEKGYFVEPTIFTRVPDSSKLATEEIFGPVLSIMTPFNTVDEAIERANSTVYGLGAGVFTSNMSVAELFVRRVVSGTVWVNHYNLTNYNIPFGGFKQSGFGRDNAYEAVSEFTTTKAVYYKHDFQHFK